MIIFSHQKCTFKCKIENQILTVKNYHKLQNLYSIFDSCFADELKRIFGGLQRLIKKQL